MKYSAEWRAFILSRDDASLRTLFIATFGNLYTYGMKVCGDPVMTNDAIQEVFLNLWQYRNQLNPDSRGLPYLLRAVRNEIFRLTKRFGVHEDLDGAKKHLAFIPEEFRHEGLSDVECQAILAGLNALPPRQREILYFRYYDDLSYEDIASVLGITYQSVVNQAFRAISKLRKSEAFRRFYAYAF